MWSPPAQGHFDVGGYGEVEADVVGEAGGLWDGASWRSAGVVADEGGSFLIPDEAGVGEFDAVGSIWAAPWPPVGPLEAAPAETAFERMADSVPPVLPPVASSAVAPEDRLLESIPNSTPPLADSCGDDLEEAKALAAPEAPSSSASTILPGIMHDHTPKLQTLPVAVAAAATVDATKSPCPESTSSVSVDDHAVPGVGNSTVPRRSPRVAAAKAASLQQNGGSFMPSNNSLVDSSVGQSHMGSGLPNSTKGSKHDTILMLPGAEQRGNSAMQASTELVAGQSSSFENENSAGVLHDTPIVNGPPACSLEVVMALPAANAGSLKRKGSSLLPSKKIRLVLKKGLTVQKVTPCMTPTPSGRCLPNLNGAEGGSAALCGSETVGVTPQVVSRMSLKQKRISSRSPRRAKISLGKRSANLMTAESSGGVVCQSTGVSVTPSVVNAASPDQEVLSSPPKKRSPTMDKCLVNSEIVEGDDARCFFVGQPVPDEDARRRWPDHYVEKNKGSNTRMKGKRSNTQTHASTDGNGVVVLDVKCHYLQASICGSILCIGDCAFVSGPKGEPNFVGRIMEFFETISGEYYFTAQWFFRAEDTVMQEEAQYHDKKRLFYSDLKDDNTLSCITSKVTVVQVSPSVDRRSMSNPSFHYYYDMKYSVEYTTFSTMETVSGNTGEINDAVQSSCPSMDSINKKHNNPVSEKRELALLDLYCGCGGMSTGLCLGARNGSVDLVAKWAIDYDEAACESLRKNHPEARVRNETADDFLDLLKQWEKLCKEHVKSSKVKANATDLTDSRNEPQDCSAIPSGELEVLKLVDICFGDPNYVGKCALHFKVRWKGYGPRDDTWEPIEGLSNCKEAIQDFVIEGHMKKILPLPGDADVICGGPPCQGISGFNRSRNFNAPLEDERNRQIVVFMDIVEFLKPKYVLMENVVDILKFADARLTRCALSRLVAMHYQARLGIMVAGCYGLPQFRMRVFLLGCHPKEKLPPFPLPTHDVLFKYGCPKSFQHNLVGYDEGEPRQLGKALVLEDALSDLPEVANWEIHDEMPYIKAPQTEFQRYIRTSNFEVLCSEAGAKHSNSKLCDHRPLPLNKDDYSRVSQIPKKKGANFRDLLGIVVGPDNVARLNPTEKRESLPSGKPLVPDHVLTYENGKSVRPFARLWWDDIVSTVVTVPNYHCQALLHPEQDRVLTIRETARLQGFPDHYRFCGTVRDRYRQIGNAVAIPVGRALGYAIALAYLKKTGDGPLMKLPPNFAFSHDIEGLSIVKT